MRRTLVRQAIRATRYCLKEHLGLRNPVGIYHVDENIRQQVFGNRKAFPDEGLVAASKEHLEANKLLGRKTSEPVPTKLELPKLLGKDLDEHFQKIGKDMAEPYLSLAKQFTNQRLPPRPSPDEYVARAGWTKYEPGKEPVAVEYPEGNCIVFDTEVLYHVHDFAIIATAATPEAWYVWLSPWLLDESKSPRQLIPLGDQQQVVVGHNIGYDRKRIKEEYHLKATDTFFMDTMSLHIATAGMCSRQRPTWMKLRKQVKKMSHKDPDTDVPLDSSSLEDLNKELHQEAWFHEATLNNLADIVEFHTGEIVDKSTRDTFGEATREELLADVPSLIDYCARDVEYTKLIFNKLLPGFLELCPHPVSFGALKPMTQLFLPIDGSWQRFIDTAEKTYSDVSEDVVKKLEKLAIDCVHLGESPETLQQVLQDPWLSQLDWTVKPIRMAKAKKGQPPRLAKNQKMPGKPEWFKELYPSPQKPINLSLRTRVAPILLKLQWDGNPLVWTDKYGWCFWANERDLDKYTGQGMLQIEDHGLTWPGKPEPKVVIKVPHSDGNKARCTNPMAKGYVHYFDNGTLTSDNPDAVEAIRKNIECAYWISARRRICSQMPVYQEDTDMGIAGGAAAGMILPKLIPMGTVTRRAVEDTWLTASNAKKNRIGSELKAMVRAPKGYAFVGADVDSEELWIASLLGDAVFGLHGGTALGWMTLEGSKGEGTDLHSRTAEILGISRNEAKIFNYGRIYGAGLSFAVQLLKRFDPELTDEQAAAKATRLYTATKGNKIKSKAAAGTQLWQGGSESVVFNQLEVMARQEHQRTPVLGAGITEALRGAHLSKSNNFLTSRINWTIQSSGVDYLHLLIASMHYLCAVYDIPARLFLTVHDEIRYIVPEQDSLRTALALQIANLWTRAMFCQQLGLDDVPHSVAFFSLIDVDHVLRKEVDDACVTPSNREAIPSGKAYDLQELLAACPSLGTINEERSKEFSVLKHQERTPVIQDINYGENLLEYVHAQVRPPKKRSASKSAREPAGSGELSTGVSSSNPVRGFAWNGTRTKPSAKSPGQPRGTAKPKPKPEAKTKVKPKTKTGVKPLTPAETPGIHL